MIDPLLASLMTQTVYAYLSTGTSPYGQPVFSSTPITIPCHIVGRIQEVVTPTGEAAMSTGVAICADVYPGLSDAAVLDVPDLTQASGRSRVNIIAIVTRYDEAGAHHQSIYYGPRGASGREMTA